MRLQAAGGSSARSTERGARTGGEQGGGGVSPPTLQAGAEAEVRGIFCSGGLSTLPSAPLQTPWPCLLI